MYASHDLLVSIFFPLFIRNCVIFFFAFSAFKIDSNYSFEFVSSTICLALSFYIYVATFNTNTYNLPEFKSWLNTWLSLFLNGLSSMRDNKIKQQVLIFFSILACGWNVLKCLHCFIYNACHRLQNHLKRHYYLCV